MVKNCDLIAALMSNIPEEMMREAVGERMNVNHTESQRSPENGEVRICGDGVPRKRRSTEEQSFSTSTVTTPLVRDIEKQRSATSVEPLLQNPNFDSESYPSSRLRSRFMVKCPINVEEKSLSDGSSSSRSTTSVEPVLQNPKFDSDSSPSSRLRGRPMVKFPTIVEEGSLSDGSSSCSTVTTPLRVMIKNQRSFTSVEPVVQEPNLDSDSSRSSCVRGRSKGKQPVDMGKKSHKKRKVDRGLDVEPEQMIPPEWLLDVMRREGNGYDPKLISTRKLFASDLNKKKARLSVPFLQVHNPDFLTVQERIHIHENAVELREEGVSVDLVDPKMKKHALDLRKWKMNGNWYYTFCKAWNHVLEANKSLFKVKDVYPLWSFRSGNGKLCFALVPSDQETSSSHEGGSTSGESDRGSSLTGRDGASTSGESAQIPLPVNHPSPPAGKRF